MKQNIDRHTGRNRMFSYLCTWFEQLRLQFNKLVNGWTPCTYICRHTGKLLKSEIKMHRENDIWHFRGKSCSINQSDEKLKIKKKEKTVNIQSCRIVNIFCSKVFLNLWVKRIYPIHHWHSLYFILSRLIYYIICPLLAINLISLIVNALHVLRNVEQNDGPPTFP